jgi:protochlorophyllide reductase
VERFTKAIIEGGNCDIILASAAEINTEPGALSADGYDKTFATNHLGLQQLLTGLESLSPSRVVMVSSRLGSNGEVDPAVILNTNAAKLNERPGKFNATKHYGDSKLCNQLMATVLASRWPDSKVFTVSPGMVNTGLWRNFPAWFQILTWPIRTVALRTPHDAAQGVVYACASEEADKEATGSFFIDGIVEESSEQSRDLAKAKALWNVCEELIQRKSAPS